MKRSIITVLLLLVAATAFAQSKIATIHYDVSLPGEKMDGYIGETSWLGVGADGRWFVTPDSPIALGISTGWHVFDRETDGTIVFDNGALTGTQRRYINSVPLMMTAHCYFGDKDRIRLFAGGGIGTYAIIQRFEVGVFAYEKTNWHFGLYPEIGTQIYLTDLNIDIFVSGRYNYAFEAGESLTGDAKAYDYWTMSVGVAYREW